MRTQVNIVITCMKNPVTILQSVFESTCYRCRETVSITSNMCRCKPPILVAEKNNVVLFSVTTEKVIHTCKSFSSLSLPCVLSSPPAPPMIRLSVNDTVVVDPGQDVLLTCEVTAGFPSPTVTWLRYPGPLPLSAQVRGPTLILRAVTPADGGFYNCTAVNNVGNPARKNVNLIVRSKCVFIPR